MLCVGGSRAEIRGPSAYYVSGMLLDEIILYFYVSDDEKNVALRGGGDCWKCPQNGRVVQKCDSGHGI